MMGLLAVSWCTLICTDWPGTMSTLVQLFLKMFWRVVSVGVSGVLLLHVDLLSNGSHDEHLHSNLLRFASHDELLGVLVLDDDDAGVECRRRRQRSASSRQAPRTCPLQ
jgi:hypothetical protein